MGRRNQHSREEQIEMAISAAELLIVTEGLAGLSMRKVATAMGYTVGQLYLIFKNQDDLLLAVNRRTADEVYASLRLAVEQPIEAAPATTLHHLAAAYIDYARAHPKRWALMFEHRLPEDAEIDDATRDSIAQSVQRIFELVEGELAVALPALSDNDLRQHSTALWSGVHGICVLAITRKLEMSGVTDYRGLCQLLVDRFLNLPAKPLG